MPKKTSNEFEKFDETMEKLLAVPYSELQKKLEEEKVAKAKKKARTPKTSGDRASSGKKKS